MSMSIPKARKGTSRLVTFQLLLALGLAPPVRHCDSLVTTRRHCEDWEKCPEGNFLQAGGKNPTASAIVSGGWSSKALSCAALPEDHFCRQGGQWKRTYSKGIFSENKVSAD